MRRSYVKYVVSLLLFGSNGVVASRISMNSYEIVFFRTLVGGLSLLAVYILSGRRLRIPENRKHFIYLIISGAALGTSWMFLFEAYARIGVSIATLAYYCGPVLVMALAPVLFRERISGTVLIGLCSVIAGMFLVNCRSLLHGHISHGLLCGMSSAVMYAVMIIFTKKAATIKGLQNPMYQLIAAFCTVAVFTFAKQGIPLHISRSSILPILTLGIVNTGIGCYLYFLSVRQLPAQSVAICGYIEPLSALVFSALFLGENLTTIQILGAVLILGGAILGGFHDSEIPGKPGIGSRINNTFSNGIR